ncbi:glycosyltransferase family 4 protein [Pseudomonas gingeri]|uniref:glycosyltransferase family 4 protein n=1 Tax=Pseudomonas gingeri TaxID=117681 RepID=UPI0015A173BA|nr:glycosyltransferase family 4 protein [Pseudomonas gingeri]NVZ73751.1 glycosyltransferase family 4 protein [Pseudomonas gingeri]
MKLLIVSQYFSPEHFIINDIVGKLTAQGHEVVVATGKPNYPDGEIYPGYSAWGCQRDRYLDTVDVLRVPLWPRGKGGAKNMVLNYLSFVLAGLVFFPWMLRKREFDAILVFAPSPITQAIPAILLKYLKKAHLALWIQDLWPESLAATGFVKNRFLLSLVGRMVRCIYSCCDRLLVQSRAFIDPVADYAPREKIFYYPNSINVSPSGSGAFAPVELQELLDKHFCVVFAGNLGTAQALDTLLQAAILLRDEEDIRLVLVGSGSRLAWLKAQKELHGLENLILPGRFPADAMPDIFAKASALLVSLNDEEIFSHTIPSKVQAYLAAGRPIIACLNGEGARVVQEAGAGFCSPAEQVGPLVEAIREMRGCHELDREKMGLSGRAYFDQHFDMDMQVSRLVELFRH